MGLKVKRCAGCHRSYALEEFGALKLLSIDPSDEAETRACACGQGLTVDVRALERLDLRTPAEVVRDDLLRVRRARRARVARIVAAVAVVVGSAVTAFVLW